MQLRGLYLTKRALLALQRKALVHSMASFDSQLAHPSDNSVSAADMAAQVKDIAFEDEAVLHRVARPVWLGLSFFNGHIAIRMIMPEASRLRTCVQLY